jgi:hypothetical protein
MSFKNIPVLPGFSVRTCREYTVNYKHRCTECVLSNVSVYKKGEKLEIWATKIIHLSLIVSKVVKNHMRKVGTSIPEAGLAAIRSDWR